MNAPVIAAVGVVFFATGKVPKALKRYVPKARKAPKAPKAPKVPKDAAVIVVREGRKITFKKVVERPVPPLLPVPPKPKRKKRPDPPAAPAPPPRPAPAPVPAPPPAPVPAKAAPVSKSATRPSAPVRSGKPAVIATAGEAKATAMAAAFAKAGLVKVVKAAEKVEKAARKERKTDEAKAARKAAAKAARKAARKAAQAARKVKRIELISMTGTRRRGKAISHLIGGGTGKGAPVVEKPEKLSRAQVKASFDGPAKSDIKPRNERGSRGRRGKATGGTSSNGKGTKVSMPAPKKTNKTKKIGFTAPVKPITKTGPRNVVRKAA